MGALHAGHESLIHAATRENDIVAVSIFVNPLQFGPSEDFERYPRRLDEDMRILARHFVHAVYAPRTEMMYPPEAKTRVRVTDLEGVLEGHHRPGHFEGVATMVTKLLNAARPHRAYFGQKDAQQAALLRRLVRDLNLDLELRILPTVRDVDGLALSSRNAYLAPAERERALALPRALDAGRSAYAEGADPIDAARAALNGLDPDYVDVLELGDAKLLAAAARVGSTRLIDNVVLKGELA
jgi:pantoate--beta-alanine ligase